jgi:hypothetical protein
VGVDMRIILKGIIKMCGPDSVCLGYGLLPDSFENSNENFDSIKGG